MLNKLFKTVITTALLLGTATALAKQIHIYNQPNPKAKVTFTIQSGDELIPIFHTKDKVWIKVANPKDGNVGWAKRSELKTPLVTTKITDSSVEQQVILRKDDKGGSKYKFMRYDAGSKLTPQQLKEMQEREIQIQQNMQKLQINIQEMIFKMFKNFFSEENMQSLFDQQKSALTQNVKK